MSEKIKIKDEVQGAGATDGKEGAITEARAILARYRPQSGKGASLNEPSQGEAQRMLDCIQGLYAIVNAPSARVQHQEVKLETR